MQGSGSPSFVACVCQKEERGLSPVTIHKRRQHVTQFLSRFEEQHPTFSEISILDIDAAIARKGEQDAYSRSSMKTYAQALRAFFHYAEQRGWCAPGLAQGDGRRTKG